MEPVEEKVLTCEEIQANLKNDLENAQIIEDDQIINKFDRIIEGLIQGSDEGSRNAALELLKFIMENFTSVKVNLEVVKLLNNPNVSSEVYDMMLDAFKESLVKSIENQTFLASDYIPAWKEESALFVDIMENTASKVDAKKLLLTNIIPELMQPTIENDVRNVLLDIAFKFIPLVPITSLTPEEFRDLSTKTAENYSKVLIELRDKEYENWHNIWIFLIKFCERRLHGNMSLTNSLLRIVENAFRNNSPSQRLKGYDCWLVLIDNASLSLEHFTSAKQMKLLITPLKAKFSKQQEVIVKRFEVFIHLLEKLKYKATLCLTEFLEFCFGAVGPNSDPVKTGHGKSTPILWDRIVVAFMEILGHTDGCSEKLFDFAPAFLTGVNIGQFFDVVVKSVFECCAMMNSFPKQKRDKQCQCLWVTLFSLIGESPVGLQEKIVETVCGILKKLSEIDSLGNRNVLWNFLVVLLSKDSDFHKILFKKCMSIVAPFLLSEDMSTITYERRIFKDMVTFTLENDVNFRAVLDSFDNNLGSDNVNLTLACDLWLSFSKYIMLDVYSSTEYDFSSFMLWPLPIYALITEDILKDIGKTWNNTYAKITEKSDKNKSDILDGVESLYDNDKLTRSGLIMLVEAVTKAETQFMPNIVPKILGIISSVLILPNLDAEQFFITKTAFFLFLNPSINFYKANKDDIDISMVCECLDQLLETHKDFDVLPLLLTLFQEIPAPIKLEFAKVLLEKMVDLLKTVENNDLTKIIALLSEDVQETEETRPKRTRSSDIDSPSKKRRKTVEEEEESGTVNGEQPKENGTEKVVKNKRKFTELPLSDDLIQTSPRIRTSRTDLAQILRNEEDERYNEVVKSKDEAAKKRTRKSAQSDDKELVDVIEETPIEDETIVEETQPEEPKPQKKKRRKNQFPVIFSRSRKRAPKPKTDVKPDLNTEDDVATKRLTRSSDTPVKTAELTEDASVLAPIVTADSVVVKDGGEKVEKVAQRSRPKPTKKKVVKRLATRPWSKGIISTVKTKQKQKGEKAGDEVAKRKMFKPPIKADPDMELSNLFDESANITTEDSLEITNALLLDDNKPIYPGLVSCDHDIYNLVKILATPHYLNSWHKKLLQLGIKTVGDLASKTQSEVNRLPLKAPVVPKVLKAFEEYFNGIEDAELLTQIEHIISKIKHKGDLGQVLYKTVGMEGLKTLVDDLEMDILDVNPPADKDKFETLLRSLKVNSLDTLLSGLRIAIKRKYIRKTEFFKECVFPLIKVPYLLDPYFKGLTANEINNFVVKYVQPENVSTLLSCLRHHHGSLFVTKIIDNVRKNNITTPDVRDVHESLISGVAEENKTEVLVDLFRKISAKLPESTLFDMHIEFLNRLKTERNK